MNPRDISYKNQQGAKDEMKMSKNYPPNDDALYMMVKKLHRLFDAQQLRINKLELENFMLYDLAASHNIAMCDTCHQRHFSYPSVNGLVVNGEGVCTHCLKKWWFAIHEDGDEYIESAAQQIASWYLQERPPGVSWVLDYHHIDKAAARILASS
jgi:predicted CXXCH cytochrome family protein